MNRYHAGLLARRIGSLILDAFIEFGGGLLGSYFGAMVAALVTALNYEDPLLMQDSIWRGFGFGFVFCSLAISFVNRVLIQGLSRASLGKKFFKLELVTSTRPFTWQLMIKRWLLGQVSMATGGLGYISMFFNPEHRALHDIYLGMDVVPVFNNTYAIEAEYTYAEVVPMPQPSARVIILTNDTAERPMATVIQLPVANQTADGTVPVETQAVENSSEPETEKTLADVIQINKSSDQKKAA